MSFRKNIFKLARTLLIGGIAFGFIGGQSLDAASYGTLRIDKPLTLVAENNQQVLLLSTPSLKQHRELVQKILPTNPGKYGYRRLYSPQLIRIDRMGKQTIQPVTFVKIGSKVKVI